MDWTRDHYQHGSRSLVDLQAAESDIERAAAAVRVHERARDLFMRQVEVLACEYPAGERVPTAELRTCRLRCPRACLPNWFIAGRTCSARTLELGRHGRPFGPALH